MHLRMEYNIYDFVDRSASFLRREGNPGPDVIQFVSVGEQSSLKKTLTRRHAHTCPHTPILTLLSHENLISDAPATNSSFKGPNKLIFLFLCAHFIRFCISNLLQHFSFIVKIQEWPLNKH